MVITDIYQAGVLLLKMDCEDSGKIQHDKLVDGWSSKKFM